MRLDHFGLRVYTNYNYGEILQLAFNMSFHDIYKIAKNLYTILCYCWDGSYMNIFLAFLQIVLKPGH